MELSKFYSFSTMKYLKRGPLLNAIGLEFQNLQNNKVFGHKIGIREITNVRDFVIRGVEVRLHQKRPIVSSIAVFTEDGTQIELEKNYNFNKKTQRYVFIFEKGVRLLGISGSYRNLHINSFGLILGKCNRDPILVE